MELILATLTAWTLIKAACGIGLAVLLCRIFALGMHTLKVLGRRMNRTSGQAAYLAADAVAVALAWPLEWALDRASLIVAKGSDWRAQRKVWREEFRQTMSWAEFQAQLAGKQSPDALSDALSLFGLKEPFSQADLDTRFKRIIKSVHPDTGGSEYLARMVNDARTLILERKGWS